MYWLVFSFLRDNFFHATVDGLPCGDYLESQGWELWGQKYKSQKIVSIYGIDEFFLDDEWYDEWGSIEEW